MFGQKCQVKASYGKALEDNVFQGKAIKGNTVNTSGKTGAHILHLPLGDESSPSGDSTVSR
jgi:hypothetical protein